MPQPGSPPRLRHWAFEHKSDFLHPSIAVPKRLWAMDDPNGSSAVLLYSNPPGTGWPQPLLNRTDGIHDEETVLKAIKGQWPDANIVRVTRAPGEQYPRIWRGPSYRLPNSELASFGSSVNSTRLLTERFRQVALTVEPQAENRAAFGHELRHLLILAASEVESAWKAIYVANKFPPAERYNTQDYSALIDPLRLREWGVSLSMYPDYGIIKPFETWDPRKPTASLPWYAAYNTTKHDREGNLKSATLENVISALAGLFVMLCAQFGPAYLKQDPYSIPEFTVLVEPQWDLKELYVPIVSKDVEIRLVPLNG